MAVHASPTDFTIGQRVELHPATDAWMSGARFGEVAQLGRRYVYVRLDATGRICRLDPSLIARTL